MSERRAELDRFYGLLAELEERCGGKRRLAECHGRMGWPRRGIYFFFEDGEVREDGVSPRIVRVGTHALGPSKSTLWGRLSQHRGTRGGSERGGGNHRGSVFRKHVGSALLASGEWPEAISGTWAVGNSAPSDVMRAEYPLERAVSEHIGAMPFLWLEVDDPDAAGSDRGVIEAGAIALLSNLRRDPVDPPSAGWLGLRASANDIRGSGLWNVHHVQDAPGGAFLDVLAGWVRRVGSAPVVGRGERPPGPPASHEARTTSPFLTRSPGEWVASNELAFAIRDAFPVSPGHSLVIPRREIASWFKATPAERVAMLELVDTVRRELDSWEPAPDGYNIGINVGEAAGQTVMHLHIHVIPRYRGDVPDPRGGVRHVIPGKGNYLGGR